ncbi:uncharacterized protein LOC118188297 [Stegodyphus dumicola]|uniref:uncharacterized protein LOC118188297 n=1 Tax=Stegodyphus dumicola TaxID=202533 RepID=UPI0015AB9C5B|nr:uncharacterized protein LOC118188297 [Stegodyphus dumicola]
MGEQVFRLPCGTSNNHHGKLWRCGRLFWNYPMPSDSSTESVSSGTALSVPEEADVPPVSDLRPSSTADSVYPHRRRASSCRNVGNGGRKFTKCTISRHRLLLCFRSYIDLFLKIKQESSGWPSECVTEEARLKYIRQYEEREGVKLEAEKISKNPGRRQVAKLALNSFWGRWGMNVNKAQLTYVHTVPDFNKMLADSTKKIKDVFLPTPEVAAISWESAKEFVPQDASTIIFLATFTTAWARLKPYSEMEKFRNKRKKFYRRF